MARSCLPSPLKSPTATEKGLVPAPKLVAAPKLPVPSPNKIDTLFEFSLATARSCLPSPLKSPTATEPGIVPTPKLVAALKLPVPLPNKIDTLSESMLATARSCLPSPLKSPTATELGTKASPEIGGCSEAHRSASRWCRYCQGERLRCGRAAVEGSDCHSVRPRGVCIRYAHYARRRITFQLAFEVGRGGNIDARRVGRRGIRRNRRVGAEWY